ncbi:MAG TPA: glucose-1-phosphate adenylyltransferase [Candidatus Omnitrophota bacterium]|nr:glucose-1-phosphate adenylyltransferase [Candidatus Omnitrophota bacterium]
MSAIISIILGGGHGKRLFPLTRDRAKPAVPIGGKYRLVDIPISNSLNSGVKTIFVLTQFNSVSLHRHILNTYRFDYFNDASVELLAAEQTLATTDWFQGTADAVRKHFDHYHIQDEDEVMILSGDHLYRMDLQKMIRRLRETNADFVVAVAPVKKTEVRHFGILKMNPEGRIIAFKEKPKTVTAEDSYEGKFLASMGIYAFRARVLKKILEGNESDFGREVIPNSILRYHAQGYVFEGYWRDIGTIESFYEANLELAAQNPPFSFVSASERIYTHPRFLPPSRVMGAKIDNSLISEGSLIRESEISRSIVGLRSVVRRNTVICDSIVMGADFFEEKPLKDGVPIGIGPGCHIEKAILDKNVRIGARVQITNPKKLKDFDGENYFIRDGIVVIPKNAVIPSGTII